MWLAPFIECKEIGTMKKVNEVNMNKKFRADLLVNTVVVREL